MAEAMDEIGPFMILEDYFDDEQLEISFSNMSIEGEYQLISGQMLYCYINMISTRCYNFDLNSQLYAL